MADRNQRHGQRNTSRQYDSDSRRAANLDRGRPSSSSESPYQSERPEYNSSGASRGQRDRDHRSRERRDGDRGHRDRSRQGRERRDRDHRDRSHIHRSRRDNGGRDRQPSDGAIEYSLQLCGEDCSFEVKVTPPRGEPSSMRNSQQRQQSEPASTPLACLPIRPREAHHRDRQHEFSEHATPRPDSPYRPQGMMVAMRQARRQDPEEELTAEQRQALERVRSHLRSGE